MITLQLSADHVITFFIRPYPHADKQEQYQSMVNKLRRPGKLAKYHLKKMFKDAPSTGIFSTYAGFLALSNGIGQTTFPRKHEEPDLTIIICNRIQPMLMAANTINHWEFMPNTPATAYAVKRKEDEQTGLVYWDINKTETPINRIIPTQSILIFAKPKNFFIPEGISLTTNSPNLVLPTIYARRETDIATNALRVLAIRQFFDSVKNESKLDGKMYQIHEVY